MTFYDDYMDKNIQDDANEEMPVDKSKIAKVGMQMVNGYCHITYAYHNEKDDHTFVAGARKNIVIGNWKSNGSQSLVDYFNMCVIPVIQNQSAYIDCVIAPPEIYAPYM